MLSIPATALAACLTRLVDSYRLFISPIPNSGASGRDPQRVNPM